MSTRAHDRSPRVEALWWLAGGFPAWLGLLLLLAQQPWLMYPKVLIATLCTACWLGVAWRQRHRIDQRQRLLGSLIERLTQDDYSQRLRPSAQDEALSVQINGLIDHLHTQRRLRQEAQSLAGAALDGLDVAVFGFDAKERLQLANPRACRLLNRGQDDLLGQDARALGLDDLLHADTAVVQQREFPAAAGLWRLRREPYRVQGQLHWLLFITDLQQVLREEEMRAWQRLLRVLSHEVHNSLAPIASMSDSLRQGLAREPAAFPDEWREDADEALRLMQERAQHLSSFVRRYAQLARLPEPRPEPFDLGHLLQRLPLLLPQAPIELQFLDEQGQRLSAAPRIDFLGDQAQIEQLLINLLRNGWEAGGAPLLLRCQCAPLEIAVLDRGCGIVNPANLFVPFYTTKPEGSGIGLVLSRQIAERHHGTLSLQARDDGPGSMARLRFPLHGRGAVKQ